MYLETIEISSRGWTPVQFSLCQSVFFSFSPSPLLCGVRDQDHGARCVCMCLSLMGSWESKTECPFQVERKKKPTTFKVNNCFYSPNYTRRRHLHSHSHRHRQRVAIWDRTNWFWCMSSVCECVFAPRLHVHQLQCIQWINYMLPFFGFIHLCAAFDFCYLFGHSIALLLDFVLLCCKVWCESGQRANTQRSHWTERADAVC